MVARGCSVSGVEIWVREDLVVPWNAFVVILSIICTSLLIQKDSWRWKNCARVRLAVIYAYDLLIYFYSSMVVDHLRGRVQDNKTCVACIYLNHKETSIHTAPNLLASLWKQLVLGKPIPPKVAQLYENHLNRSTKPSLDEILQILQSAIAVYSKVYLLVDALDEYPEPQRNILLEYLSTINGPTVNLMLTSRPHIALHPFFPKLDILEIRATEDDICRYIDMHVLKSPRLSKHVRARPELHGEIRSKILTNVEGM
jgi:hypothetical protein